MQTLKDGRYISSKPTKMEDIYLQEIYKNGRYISQAKLQKWEHIQNVLPQNISKQNISTQNIIMPKHIRYKTYQNSKHISYKTYKKN